MSWSEKYKRSIDCNNPKGFSQKAHCQGKKKKMTEEKKDHEYSMARSQLKTVANATKRLQKKMGKKGEGELQAWVQSKITKAADYIDTAADYVTNEETIAEKRDGKSAKDPGYSLRDWFKGGGWVQAGGKYDGKPCAKQPGQKTKPFCRDADDRASMSKDERERRAKKKRREDPNPERKGKAKMVSEAKGEKDACYKKVKSRYSVWPSAYASGALVKCRKVGAANWGNKTKKEGYEFSNWRDDFQATEYETVDIIKPEPLKPTQSVIDEAGKKCWKGYKKKGTQELFGKTYNRCVKEETKTFSQFMEDWQKVNKSDKTDGMSPAAVKAYRRENPGSKLKTAVTGDPKPGSKDAKRRKSFCARSKGQQDMHNIDCSKTPDKPVCKARRRWKC